MLHICIRLQGGVMERCRLWSEQDITRRLRVDGRRKSRREEEKENEIGESVWAACGGTEGLCMVGSVGGLRDSP
ncbi:hypothetical protein QQF64_020547 [Cirrhinus molitorella]|uniref:Uncharacterized protein n=1 Tax=Cirrhinus molitorella TaxID=172907 RepID=A0ABR3L9H9_9TELE